MKKINKKLNSFTALIVVAAIALASAPSKSFAKNDNENQNNSNSIWGRMFAQVGTHADAKNGDGEINNENEIKTNLDINIEDVEDTDLSPNILSIKAPTVLKAGVVGTWTVKASDPEDGNLSYAVNWGDNTPQPMANTAAGQAFVQTSTFTHAYASPGIYTVTFTVSNDVGLEATSTVTVSVISSHPDQAPVISNLSATSKRPHNATLRWTTDVRSSSLVWYSTSSPINTSLSANVSRAAKVLNHRIGLANLQPNTKYYVIVASANDAGLTKYGEISFTTPSVTAF